MRGPDRDLGRIADIMNAASNLAEFTECLASVLPELLWDTATRDVPALINQLR